MTILPRPSEWARSAAGGSKPESAGPRSPHYFAFLSYSHRDEDMAKWLHDSLEKFRVPSYLVGQLTEHGPVPARLTPIFRDLRELPASDDVGSEIRTALAHSRFLIVLCSPAAAKSRWANAEIEAFKRVRAEGCILAAVVSGEPFASDMPGREEEECLPPALRYHYDRRGKRTSKRAEPLAADLREPGEARRLGFLKLVAGMLGLGLDDLVQREALRRQRRLGLVAAAALAGMVVTSGLAVTAFQARDEARDQRREAEGLVAFMLGDLKEKLEPIGRLDALDGVGSRVLDYYSGQDASELSDESLLKRSRALSLIANVAYVRGDLDGAQRLYREATAGTAEAIRRDPSDPQRLFDHAQNVFWTADIGRQRGQLAQAEAGMREYKRLADQMVALAPDNMKWRMEQQSADTNLGVLLLEQRRFGEATAQFATALRGMEALATADPLNTDYQKSVTESQAWLASALTAEGRLEQATNLRERHVTLLEQLLNRTRDVEYRQKLVPAERYLGELHWFRGDVDEALKHFRAAVEHSEVLIAREPTNFRWRGYSARARLNLAESLLFAGQKREAARETATGCSVTARLLAADADVQGWRASLRECWEMRSRLSLADGNLRQALRFAATAVETGKSIRSIDPVEDKYAVAQSYRLLGDVQQRLGDKAGAQAAWQTGHATLPSRVAEKPDEMAERALLLQRLQRAAEADAVLPRLGATGYRQPPIRTG